MQTSLRLLTATDQRAQLVVCLTLSLHVTYRLALSNLTATGDTAQLTVCLTISLLVTCRGVFSYLIATDEAAGALEDDEDGDESDAEDLISGSEDDEEEESGDDDGDDDEDEEAGDAQQAPVAKGKSDLKSASPGGGVDQSKKGRKGAPKQQEIEDLESEGEDAESEEEEVQSGQKRGRKVLDEEEDGRLAKQRAAVSGAKTGMICSAQTGMICSAQTGMICSALLVCAMLLQNRLICSADDGLHAVCKQCKILLDLN